MKKDLLLMFLSFTLFVLNTQGQILKKLTNGISDVIETGKAKTIYKEIKDQDFLKANEKLEEFKVKYPSNATVYYLAYLIYSSESSKFINYDLAYKNMSKLLDDYFYKMDKDERESYCKDIDFCEDNLKREYDQIQLKLLNTNKNDENSITQLINNYPKSKYLDSAVRIRHQIRYKKASTQNTIDSYSDFINKNPYARQQNEAEYNLRILAFKEAEWENTAASYEYFIRNYSGENILDKRALSRLKYIRYKKVIDDYGVMKKQIGGMIDDFTKEKYSNNPISNLNTNEFQIQNSSSKYFGKGIINVNQNKINRSEIKGDNIVYNSKIHIDPILYEINQFISMYSGSLEILVLKNMKKELEDLKVKIDYFIVSGFMASEKTYQTFIETYPQSTYSIILKNKISEVKYEQNRRVEVDAEIASDKINAIKRKEGLIKIESVKIGTQTWMSENLNASIFRNGDIIKEVKDKHEWIDAMMQKIPAYSYFENDSDNGLIFGKLYNWWAVIDPRGLAPIGWHIPSKDEFSVLINFLGANSGKSGVKMKSKWGWGGWKEGGQITVSCPNCLNWNAEYRRKVPCHMCQDYRSVYKTVPVVTRNGNGTNSSGFDGRPGGYRQDDGDFAPNAFGPMGRWWTSTIIGTTISNCRLDQGEYANLTSGATNIRFHIGMGLSVRCVKD